MIFSVKNKKKSKDKFRWSNRATTRSIVCAKGARFATAKFMGRDRHDRKSKSSYKRRNATLKKLGFDSYSDYLESDLWREIRRRVFDRSRLCAICDKDAECIHHISYAMPVLVGKNLDPLVPVCNACHRGLEFRFDGTKRPFLEAKKLTIHLIESKGSELN